MKYCTIAKIRRPHALNGAMLADSYLENLDDVFSMEEIYIDLNGEFLKIQISSVFGFSNNKFRFLAKEIDSKESASRFNNCFLKVPFEKMPKLSSELYLEQLIGLQIKSHNRVLGEIKAIHDFGAGKIVETKSDMFPIQNLNLENIEKGYVNLN